MSAAGSFFIILVFVIASSTFASPIADCPESAAASRHDQPQIPNNDNIIPEAPLLLPPARTAAAPIIPYPDNDSIAPETQLIPSPDNNDMIPEEAPLLPPPAHTASAAAPIIPYPDNDNIVPETPQIQSPSNTNIIPEEAPLLPPPAHTAAAPQPEQTVTDGVEPLMQPSSSANQNGNKSGGGKQLGVGNHQYEDTNTNTGFSGATATIGGGVRAQPLVDNTPFDSGSTTSYGFMGFSSCIALMFLSILI